jgi:hypothetical protein
VRVIVVTHDESGQLLKVCADRDTFVDWLDRSDWERHDVDTWDANVLGAE